MAYRVPHPRRPEIVHHARRQTLVARVTGLALLWVLVMIMAFVADRSLSPEHLPWKPLRVIDPVGIATKIKAARTGEDQLACRAVLRQGGVEFHAAPEQASGFCSVHEALIIDSGIAPLKPAATTPMTCKQALAVTIWERQVVQQAAYEILGQGVVAVPNYGSYACRKVAGKEDSVSEHASANALDVAGFTLADGTEISVERDWNDAGPKGRFLHRVRDGACQVFLTTLSPDYNAAHANHLHLDMGGWPMCA